MQTLCVAAPRTRSVWPGLYTNAFRAKIEAWDLEVQNSVPFITTFLDPLKIETARKIKKIILTTFLLSPEKGKSARKLVFWILDSKSGSEYRNMHRRACSACFKLLKIFAGNRRGNDKAKKTSLHAVQKQFPDDSAVCPRSTVQAQIQDLCQGGGQIFFHVFYAHPNSKR